MLGVGQCSIQPAECLREVLEESNAKKKHPWLKSTPSPFSGLRTCRWNGSPRPAPFLPLISPSSHWLEYIQDQAWPNQLMKVSRRLALGVLQVPGVQEQARGHLQRPTSGIRTTLLHLGYLGYYCPVFGFIIEFLYGFSTGSPEMRRVNVSQQYLCFC